MISSVEWLQLVFSVLFVLLAIRFIWGMMRIGTVSPFIRTRTQVAEEVAAVFGTLPTGSTLIDPGCGDGRVLFAIAKQNPHTHFIGIELRLLPYLLALHKRKREKNTTIDFVHGNFSQHDLSCATHMYTYLYPHVMDDLLPKLEKELQPGTQLISLDFSFSMKEAVRTIPLLSAEEGKLGRLLYVYQF
ncbi:MAG: hypothetical protein AB202_02735 [Parcubacteria bacterium C7867-007]|nr:MAG: hypothetical protein AB202_02735 [Parcubacteria bacterium C7867-007]